MKFLSLFSISLLLLTAPVYTQIIEDKEQEDLNLLKNGDFESGVSGWKGDGDDEELNDGNTVMKIEVPKRKEIRIFQDFKVRDIDKILITISYKISDDFDSNGVTFRIHRPGGSTYRTFTPKQEASDEWVTTTWDYRELRGGKKASFEISVKPGESGFILFDNISIVPIE